MTDDVTPQPIKAPSLRRKIITRLLFLGIALIALYFFFPTIVSLLDEAPQLATVDWWWFILMGVLMFGAFVSAWFLTHIAVPDISLFVAACSQLVSNAMAKVLPGGAVAAGATYFQMLSVSGVPTGQAAAALAAGSFISNLVLFALPGIALLIAAVSAPIPEGLAPIAVTGTALFILLFIAVFLAVRFDRPLLLVGRLVERVVGWAAHRFHKSWNPTAVGFLKRRNEVVDALGQRWLKALVAAILNWLLDYMVLVVALIAVGADARPSLVLVAFAGSAVLGMIPITPGGLGFVEFGLVAMLTIAGIPGPTATLATLAYRLFQYWLPIPSGAVAYFVFRRQYGTPSELEQGAA